MAFSIPKEYENFVTGAEELLRQFTQESTESISSDYVSYELFPDPNIKNLSQLLEIQNQIILFVKEETRGYIWQKEPFQLRTCFEPFCLTGRVSFGDNIEDDWFITHILFEVSKRHPNLSICTRDGDGQYLLIEAADSLPEWVTPSNSTNRVWIREGRLHLVPLDEPGKLHDGGIKLEAALESVRAGSHALASSSVQASIQNRLTVYPAKSKAVMHTALCMLPRPIAVMLQREPQLVAGAVAALSVSRGEGAPHAKAITIIPTDTADFVTTPTHFSRALYAQLNFFQNFRPPAALSRLKDDESVRGSKAKLKQLDLGCRITVGLEVAYHLSKARSSRADPSPSHNEADVLNAAGLLGSRLDVGADELQRLHSEGKIALTASQQADYSSRSYHLLVDSLLRLPPIELVTPPLSSGESDAWLYLTPEEFDRELAARVEQLGRTQPPDPTPTPDPTKQAHPATPIISENTVGSNLPQEKTADPTGKVNGDDGGGDNDDDGLEEIVRGIEGFFQSKSDVAGVAPATAAPTTAGVTGGDGGGLDIDMGRLLELLREAEEQERAPAGHVSGNGAADLDPLRGFLSDDEDSDESDGSSSDADDEERAGAEEGAEQRETKEVEMDRIARPHLPSQLAECGVKQFTLAGDTKSLPVAVSKCSSCPVEEDDDKDSDDEGSEESEDRFYGGSSEEDEEGSSAGNNSEDDLDEEELFKRYSAMMEEELLHSTLSESFEREVRDDGTLGDVDIDLNLLKNLLESEAQSFGASGPMKNLLQQLGLKLPEPPKVDQKQ